MHRDTQRGFTVIELLAVVAIVAILAVIVIPMFMKDATRGKAKSEVHPVFAEISTRQDQYKVENGVYLEPGAACPASATTNGTNVSTCTDAGWTTLRVTWPQQTLSCSYSVQAGTAADAAGAVALAPSWVQSQLTAPGTSWYFVVANCPASDYFTASWDAKIRSEDGK